MSRREQSEVEATQAEGSGVGGGEEHGPVPELSELAVLGEALEDARRRSRPKQHHEGCSRRRPSGPFVLQLLRASPDSEAYALSDGQYYWWCAGLFGTGCSLPHGTIVRCTDVLRRPVLQRLHGPVGVVGRPVCAERCREVAALAEPSPGSDAQALALDTPGAAQLLGFPVPEAFLRLLRTCVDWSTARLGHGVATDTPTHLCMLLSPSWEARERGLNALYTSILADDCIERATAPALAVMAEMLRLPEAALDWRTRGEIAEMVTHAMASAASMLSRGRFQGQAFEWENRWEQEPEEEWAIAKPALEAAMRAVPVLCDMCAGPLVPVEVRFQALTALRAVFGAVRKDETARDQYLEWYEGATTALLASDHRVGASSPLALLDVALMRRVLSCACTEWQELRELYRSVLRSLVACRVDPVVHLPPRARAQDSDGPKEGYNGQDRDDEANSTIDAGSATQLLNALALEGLLDTTETDEAKEQLCAEWLGSKELVGVVCAGHLCELLEESVPDEALARLGASLDEWDPLCERFCRFSEPNGPRCFIKLVMERWLLYCPIKAVRAGLFAPQLGLLELRLRGQLVLLFWAACFPRTQGFFGHLMSMMHLPETRKKMLEYVGCEVPEDDEDKEGGGPFGCFRGLSALPGLNFGSGL
eukprot:m51a1_g1922 hypothetical protein (650) ;mRNA; r:857065-859487